MGDGRKCRECGSPIPTDGPAGLCAKCLLLLGIGRPKDPANLALSDPDSSRTSPPPAGHSPETPRPEASGGARPNNPVPTEKPGDEIRGYRLLEQIGQGGFGVVYLAEQKEPVKRRVALKIIKLGMDTRQVVARFEAERQALALMDHPNIAKILEAGATETGRPYFVMELVGGIKITDYCEQNSLTTQQRLDLFIQVCRAVQHAHQKGVIHRDLKPSNVLVATQDGVAVPKVIDFGIAKATEGKLTDETVFTAFEQFLGTPAYMSPEQAQVGGLDVDTRSDIYSLGVLLYELLTGKTPFDTKELLAAGLDAMRRTIQEKEPPTPSTRLNQELAAQQVQGSGKSKIANDLDWIVMKCLEKDRSRRYETANGLAMDLERHLKNEPVAASPPSRVYRLQKFVRRNKVTATASAVVATVLVVGVIVSTSQTARAIRAERRSIQEAVKSRRVANFLKDMLEGVGPSKARGRDATMLREILDETARQVGSELTNQPAVEVEMRLILARTYMDLGLFEQAEAMAARGAEARIRAGDADPDLAQIIYALGLSQWLLGKYAVAESTLREALATQRNARATPQIHIANTLNGLGLVLRDRGKISEAEKTFREALATARRAGGNEDREVATSLNNLSLALMSQGKFAEAEPVLSEALTLQRKLVGNEHVDVASILDNFASALYNEGRLADAEPMHREALGMRRKLLGEEHPDVANSLLNLANVLAAQGKLGEAEALQRDALAVTRKAFGKEHPVVSLVLHNLASTLQDQGNLGEAEILARDALAMRLKLLGLDHPDVDASANRLVSILMAENKLAEAEAFSRERVLRVSARVAADDPQLASPLASLAQILLLQGRFTEAEPIARQCLTIREKNTPKNWLTFSARAMLGASLMGQQKNAEAEPLLRSGYEGLKEREAQIPAQGRVNIRRALHYLVKLYQGTDRPGQAADWQQKLDDFDRAQSERQPVPPAKSSL